MVYYLRILLKFRVLCSGAELNKKKPHIYVFLYMYILKVGLNLKLVCQSERH